MEIAFFLVALAVAVLTVTSIAERLGWSAPLVLIAAGIVGSYLPFLPEVHLHHEVVLLGLLPPLLYAAALQTSLVDFNANRRPILLLSIGLVIFTTLGVGVVVHAILPSVGWAGALAIGAVVGPPDAVAATTIARRIGLPRRLVTVLEGESLLNDATALVALRTAIAAVGGSVSIWEVGLDFVVAAGGGVLIGVVTFLVVAFVRKHVQDPLLDTAISLVTPFAAYVVAEEVHSSGVIAVVIAGLLLGHNAPVLQTAASRIAERTNWRTIAYVLENTVFLLIGLQARWILADVAESDVPVATIVLLCVAALVAVIVLRLVWVFPARYLLIRPAPDASGRRPPASYTFVVGWAGMRGVVTLAAAFLLIDRVEHSEILLLVAFSVVAGTLFIQGLTLPMLVRRLRIPGPDPAEDALLRASLLQQASKAGLHYLREAGYKDRDDPYGVLAQVKQRVEQRNFAAWERLGTTADETTPSALYAETRLAMIGKEREKVLEVRSTGTVPADIVAEVLTMLDVEESMIDRISSEEVEVDPARPASRTVGSGCDHLDLFPVREPVTRGATEIDGHRLVCQPCVEDGTSWVALRRCLDCGVIGCCDSSPSRHASSHFRETTHPVMQSAEPAEDWRWCFVHHVTG